MRIKFFIMGLMTALTADYSQAINLSPDELPKLETGLGQIDANNYADLD